MAWVTSPQDERDELDEEIAELERRLSFMESGGPERITSEPEWNRATRRVRDRLRALRAERDREESAA